MHHWGYGMHFIIMWIVCYLFVIPLALVNANIARRKGRSRTFYGLDEYHPVRRYIHESVLDFTHGQGCR